MSSEHLRQSISSLLSDTISQEERQEIDAFIEEFRKQPESLGQIFELLNTLPPGGVVYRFTVSVCLAKCLAVNWKRFFMDNEQTRQTVKSALLLLLQRTSDIGCRKLIVQAMKPLLKVECERWPELFTMVSSCTENDSISMYTSIYIITHAVQGLSPATLSENLEGFLSLAINGLRTSDWALASVSAGLIAVLLGEIEEESLSAFADPFREVLDKYGALLQSDATNEFEDMAEKVGWAMKYPLPIPSDEVASTLLSFAQFNPLWASMPLADFVASQGKSLSLEMLKEVLRQTINSALSVFQADPGCGLTDNEDSMFILSVVSECKSASKKVLFREVMDIVSTTFSETQRPEAAIVAVMALSQCLESCQAVATQYMKRLKDLLFEVVKIDHLMAKEIFVECVCDLCDGFDSESDDFVGELIEQIVALAALGIEELTVKVLKCLSLLLRHCTVSSTQISLIIELMNESSSFVPPAEMYACLSSLVFSAGEEIAAYGEAILGYIMKAAEISESSDPVLRANVIEALSNIVRFCGDSVGDSLASIMKFILVTGQTEDYDIRAAVMASLSNILVTQPDLIICNAEPIRALIDHYIREELDNTEQEVAAEQEEEEMNEDEWLGPEGLSRCLTNTCLLIKNIFKMVPQMIPSDIHVWTKFCIDSMDSPWDELTLAASLTGMHIATTIPEFLEEFLPAIAKSLKDATSGPAVGVGFRATAYLMEHEIFPPELSSVVIACAKNALKGRLSCQEDDCDEDTDLTNGLYRFLAELATREPEVFPTSEFIDHCRKVEDSFEKSECIGVLRQLYVVHNERLSTLQRKFILNLFVSNLDICDFTVIPEPIIALHKVFLITPAAMKDEWLQQTLELIWSLLEQDNSGESNYWITQTNCVSFVCSLIKRSSTLIDFSQWAPRLLSVLPVKGDDMEAENIYSTLVILYDQYHEMIKDEIFRIYVQTLALPDDYLQAFRLSEETYSNLLSQVSNLLPMYSDDIINILIPNEAAQRRYRQRMGHYNVM